MAVPLVVAEKVVEMAELVSTAMSVPTTGQLAAGTEASHPRVTAEMAGLVLTATWAKTKVPYPAARVACPRTGMTASPAWT